MSALLLVACLTLGVPALESVAHAQDLAELNAMPNGFDIAKRYLVNGTAPFSEGDWHVTFSERGHAWGWDSSFYLIDVTVRAISPPRRLKPTWSYRLRVQYGSTACHTLSWAGINVNGAMRGQSPSPEEIKRRRDAGECSDVALTVWQVDDTQ